MSDKKYMTNRKKRLKLIQFSLFLLGIIIIFFTYRENNSKVKKVVSAETQIKLRSTVNNVNTGDIFTISSSQVLIFQVIDIF